MRQLYYALRTLLREKRSNLIKIISLTLGLFIAILLFARIAFELSYNTSYKEHDRLAIIRAIYTVDGMDNAPISIVMGPVAETILEEFPDEVESATVTQRSWENEFTLGDQQHEGVVMLGDTLFFQTLGITVTSGTPNGLTAPDIIFVSEEFAKRAFNTVDVVGKTMIRDGWHEVIIRGTFQSMPDHNDFRPDVVLSFATHRAGNWGYFGWGGGDSYVGFVRLQHAGDIAKINAQIDKVIEKYMPFEPEKNGWGVRYYLENICDSHTQEPTVQRMVTILSFLACSILLIAAFNYVLIVISGLSRRAKGVGVHKCNGATGEQVFGMFLWETGVILLLSLALVGVLAVNLSGLIEELLEVKLESLFALHNLWVPACVVLLTFLIAGVIPGRIFSRIPVTQVFRRYTEKNSFWKKGLLFIQFGGLTFVLGILMVVFIQYKSLMEYEWGFEPKNIASASAWVENLDVLHATVGNLPMVDKISFSRAPIAVEYSGEMVRDAADRQLFSTRFTVIDPEFVPLHQIKIVEGRNIMSAGEVLVNQTYVDRMPWTDSPLGKPSSEGHNSFGTIVGVMADFVDSDILKESRPVLFCYYPNNLKTMNVKLKEPFDESLRRLNEAMEEAYPQEEIIFTSLEQRISDKYISTRRFRDSAGIAFAAILLIALMGLIGYINDELQRRSKEIAIRKVNGAEARNIIVLFSSEVTRISLPAILISAFLSYLVSREWLEQFGGVKTDLSISLYILLSLIVLMVIGICVVTKVWRVANENPVESIKSE